MSALVDVVMAGLHAPVMYIYDAFFLMLACLMVLEFAWGRWQRKALYALPDLLTNLGMYAGYFTINLFWVPVVFILYSLVHRMALFDLGGWQTGYHGGWKIWLLLFVLEDLCFYTFHRTHHAVARLWAAHEPHHSSPFFNLSVALRQTWLPFTAVVFWLPLPLLGFDPLMVMTQQMASLFYQALLHTQAAPRLGVLEILFNTPTHHRIHHACNPPYVDKNFGGVLIIWDRIFGSFARQESANPVRYGISPPLTTGNPLRIALRSAKSLLFKP